MTTKEFKKNNTSWLEKLTEEEKEITTTLLYQLSDMLFEFWVKEKIKIYENK